MKKTIKWFSLVEIIISVSIIIIITAIAVTNYSWMQDNSNNSKVSADLKSLENSFSSYLTENEQLPLPDWNQKFYEEDTSYSHNYEDWSTFWVSGFVSENTLPKKYLNYLPTDPNTNQYYWYAKTKNFLAFEVSWVVTKDWVYKSIVMWNWWWEKWPFNLIRDHISPNFVYDNSTEYFPYNPKEKLLIWKINSFSWNLKINNRNISQTEINEIEIRQLDEITVSTWWIVDIYCSDGSNFKLWDKSSSSQLVLTNMKYNSDNNMFTSLKLLLNFWWIWTKSPKMSWNSDFEVYTPDAVASVRWTIFWVTKNTSSTNIVLVKWKLEVNKINTPTDLVKNLKEETDISTSTLSWASITMENWKSFLIVKELDEIKWLEQKPWTISTSNTWALNQIPNEVKNEIINGWWEINENIQIDDTDLEIPDFKNTAMTWIIRIKQRKVFDNSTNLQLINNWSGTTIKTNLDKNYYLSGVLLNLYNWKNNISVCSFWRKKICTKSIIINIDKTNEKIELPEIKVPNKVDKTDYKKIEFEGWKNVPYWIWTNYTDEKKVKELIDLYKEVLEIKKPNNNEFDKYYSISWSLNYDKFITDNLAPTKLWYKSLLKNSSKLEWKITDEKLKLRFWLSYDETKSKIENHLKNDYYEIYAYDWYNNYPFSPKIITGTINKGWNLAKNIIPKYENGAFSWYYENPAPDYTTIYTLTWTKLTFNQNIITDNAKKWVFINNIDRDNLYYEFNNSWYNNYKNIVFELNIRWSSLNRWDTNKEYTLLWFNNVTSSSIGRYIFINDKKIKLKTSSTWEKEIFNIDNIDNNKYYKIRIFLNKKDSSNFLINKLELYDENNKKIWSEDIENNNSVRLDEFNKIYIWSNSNLNNQLNDIIDYFKIYVKII